MKVICINPVYVDEQLINLYEVGKIYDAKYLFDRVLISDNEVIEFEWSVYCAPHNHYQFTDKEFNQYFKDITKCRDEKINIILN
jgi:hypothetical protein